MQPYGNKKSSGWVSACETRQKCPCCTGKYAKVGKRNKNKYRGAKKKARQESRRILSA